MIFQGPCPPSGSADIAYTSHKMSNLLYSEHEIACLVAVIIFNSFPAGNNFCHLLITFANSFNPHQVSQNVLPDLNPNCLTL